MYNLNMKAYIMIELNKTQKTVLKVLKDTYKKDTVKTEINALVKKNYQKSFLIKIRQVQS